MNKPGDVPAATLAIQIEELLEQLQQQRATLDRSIAVAKDLADRVAAHEAQLGQTSSAPTPKTPRSH
jgi:hypothetical protein